jgi:hypothetical protein
MSEHNPVEVVVFCFDDWKGAYVDGKLVDYGHHISYVDMINKYKCFSSIKEIWVDQYGDDFDERFGGSFPESIEDIPDFYYVD